MDGHKHTGAPYGVTKSDRLVVTMALALALPASGAPAGAIALLRNASGRQMARLKLKVTGDTAGLGTTYLANP
jgi:hypothetical protein